MTYKQLKHLKSGAFQTQVRCSEPLSRWCIPSALIRPECNRGGQCKLMSKTNCSGTEYWRNGTQSTLLPVGIEDSVSIDSKG